MIPNIVLDTNIIYAGLRSRRGASFHLLSLLGKGLFKIHLSVPLLLEYDEILLKYSDDLTFSIAEIRQLLDTICLVSQQQPIYFLWRPFLRDPDDDLVLEVAVAGACPYIITFNQRDFAGCKQFGIQAIRPASFLKLIGAIR